MSKVFREKVSGVKGAECKSFFGVKAVWCKVFA